MKVRTHSLFPVLMVLALVGGLAAGCRDESRPQSPTSPGAATSSISGTLVAGSGTAGMRPQGAGGPLSGVTVTVVRTGQTTQTDAAGKFNLGKVPAGAVELKFERSDIHASLTLSVAASSTVTVTIAVTGSTATVVSHDSGERDVHGTIKSIDTGAQSFVLTTSAGDVTVKTGTTTTFKKNDLIIAFSDLAVGDQVEVEGTLQTDGSILARKVEIEHPEGKEVEVKGTIQSIGTDSFVLKTGTGDVTVKIDSTTVFKKNDMIVAFSALAVTDQVDVEGTLQTDGSILARKVEIEHPEGKEVEVKGTIQSIGTDSFVLKTPSGPVTVQTDTATVFRGAHDSAASFSDLKAGARIEAEGMLQTDGSILAKKVKIED